MELFGLLWQILVFVIVKIFDKVAYVVDDIMFNLEDYEVYDKVVKSLSLCVGNFYFWQALATIGFYHYLRQLAAKFPPPDSIIATGIGAVDIGPSMQQLVEEKETALKEAASKNEDLDKEINGLRAKVVCLEKEVDFISKDRYALVRDKCILQNKLEDFNSWPEFRVEYDQLVTEFVAMKRQRAREHISQDQVLEIAKEAKLGLAEAKLAIAMSKVAHSEELKQVQQERDQAKESYRTLLAKTTAAAATITSTTAAVVTPAGATTHTTEVTPGDKALQEEITRLSLAFRSQTSLLTQKSSDLKRMQALLETRSNHSVSELRKAAATILNLEEEKEQADKRIAELERDAQDANAKADEMEGLYMAVAFGDEGEGETDEDEEEKGEDGDEEDGEEGAYEDGSEDDDEDDDEDEEEGGDSNEADDEGDKKTYDENEELFKDMKGSL